MLAEQKKQIYNLLKKADSAILGYTEESFKGREITFTDDREIQQTAGTNIQQTQTEKKNAFPEENISDLIRQNVRQTEGAKEGSFVGTQGASIESIAQKVASCARCPLAKTRHNVVPGEGVSTPLVMVIGEGPGADEDAQGRPFVGRAGQLLDKMLAAIGLYREKNCFIGNIVKCRPPMNRDPAPEESSACRSFLDAQIHVLKPKMILAVGRIALQNLMDTSIGITKLHGKIQDYKGIPLMATYHPSALLRDESLKRPAWEDLKTFRSHLERIVPGYAGAINS